MATCDVQTLLDEGKCFGGACLSPQQQEIVALQLLCQIANKPAGGGGGVTTLLGWSGSVTIAGTDLLVYPQLDLTGYIPGYDATVEAAIVAALTGGKQVRVNVSATVAMSLTSAGQGNLDISIFPDDGQLNYGTDINVSYALDGINPTSNQSYFDVTTSAAYPTNGACVAKMAVFPVSIPGSDCQVARTNIQIIGTGFIPSGKLFASFFGARIDGAASSITLDSVLIQVIG